MLVTMGKLELDLGHPERALDALRSLFAQWRAARPRSAGRKSSRAPRARTHSGRTPRHPAVPGRASGRLRGAAVHQTAARARRSMKRGWERTTAAVVALVISSCAPLTDEVFAPLELASSAPVMVDERAGVVEIPLRFAQPREHDLSLAYRLVGIDAQDDCQQPDFGAADGRVSGRPAPSRRACASGLPTTSSPSAMNVSSSGSKRPEGASGTPARTGRNRDRRRRSLRRCSTLGTLGVLPGAAGDQSAALQAALDQAPPSSDAAWWSWHPATTRSRA